MSKTIHKDKHRKRKEQKSTGLSDLSTTVAPGVDYAADPAPDFDASSIPTSPTDSTDPIDQSSAATDPQLTTHDSQLKTPRAPPSTISKIRMGFQGRSPWLGLGSWKRTEKLFHSDAQSQDAAITAGLALQHQAHWKSRREAGRHAQ